MRSRLQATFLHIPEALSAISKSTRAAVKREKRFLETATDTHFESLGKYQRYYPLSNEVYRLLVESHS